MAIRTIQITFTCEECKKEEKGVDNLILSTHDGNIISKIRKSDVLPLNWISIDYLHRNSSGSGGNKNSLDFCCTDCASKYFKKLK